jgi:TetR/AcrR family transcriptional regulator, transcriptional repressor for nem operon
LTRQSGFDRTDVVRRAMKLFWKDGYAATPIDALCRKTRLLRGSLYHAFGDKQGLFLESLRRYYEDAGSQAKELLSGPGGAKRNLRKLMVGWVDQPMTQRRQGSLLCNALVEVSPHDPKVSALTSGMLDDMAGYISGVLDRARAQGEITFAGAPGDMARYLMTGIMGICVMAKSEATLAQLLSTIDILLAPIGEGMA